MTDTTPLADSEPRTCRSMDGVLASERAAYAVFAAVSVFLFAASAALTIFWCTAMPAMRGMPMPGGWTMSMVWMRMPGQTWTGAAAVFSGMWGVMMVAMMLPSLAPVLWRYRQATGSAGKARRVWFPALVGLGYFLVWTLFGMAIYPPGVLLAASGMHHSALARIAPLVSGVVVFIAGWMQFSSWKAHHLDCCREAPGGRCTLPGDSGTAWRHGLTLGARCVCSCSNLTAVLLALGVMDLRAMALVTAMISVERLAPEGNRAASAVGVVLVGTGMFLIARAAGIG